MYAWIWRKIPFGLPGKLIGSLTLVAGAAALLWFAVFPAAHEYLPFNNSTVDEDDGGGGGGGGGGPDGGGDQPGSDSDRVDDDPNDYEMEDSPGPEEGESGN